MNLGSAFTKIGLDIKQKEYKDADKRSNNSDQPLERGNNARLKCICLDNKD